jgi:hypothetical protein
MAINLGDAPEAGSSKVFNGNVGGRVKGCVVTMERTKADKKAEKPNYPDFSLTVRKESDINDPDSPYVSLGLYYIDKNHKDVVKNKKKLLTNLRHVWEVCTGRPASEVQANTEDEMLDIVMKALAAIQKTGPIRVNVMTNFGTTNAPAKPFIKMKTFAPFFEPANTPDDKTKLTFSTIEHASPGVPDESSGNSRSESAAEGSTDAPAAKATGTDDW